VKTRSQQVKDYKEHVEHKESQYNQNASSKRNSDGIVPTRATQVLRNEEHRSKKNEDQRAKHETRMLK
jgi:hypothetical protein